MSSIKQDLFAISGVSSLDQESAAAVSGGNLNLSDLTNNRGTRVSLTSGVRNLGFFNNRASWYQVTGRRDWLVYANNNYTGGARRLRAGTRGNLTGFFNNDIQSARPA
jgi:hypothetical protein